MAPDILHMSRALALAERGRGRTSPNPMVGAVIVDDDGVVVGSGAHEFAGGPHAEIHALGEAGARARGATLFCTLEPCSHTGRTGPCAPRVVEAGIRRAVIAVEDPNPLVAGRGLADLRARGIDVTVGPLGRAAERLNAPFFTWMRRRRPFVTMKVALSADGRVGVRDGPRLRLTSPASDRLIHRERAEVDAIGIGSGTVLADDPLLTARGAYRARPLTRVVFDRRLRTPISARLLSTSDAGPIIIVGVEPLGRPARQKYDMLVHAGVRLELIPEALSGRFLESSLARLAELGVTSIILEGGPSLHAAAWRAGVVDRVQIFSTPVSAGPEGIPWLAGHQWPGGLEDVTILQVGVDMMIEGYVHRAD